LLFNSYVFVFLFLPCALAGFYLAARLGSAAAGVWLVLTSLVFYGWWDPRFVLLLTGSVTFNYGMSWIIGRYRERPVLQTGLLALAIGCDLGALAYFKYLYTLFQSLASWPHAMSSMSTSRTSFYRWAYRSTPSPRSATSWT
jgi:alginate O-acetyltransferase complex protein AlgI